MATSMAPPPLLILLTWFLWNIFLSQAALVKNTLTLTWEIGAPNGQARYMAKINGQFPGPELVFDENDDVEITVHNKMMENTTIHWHGLLMDGTPWSDGVPGLSQTPIEPGQTFIYRFKAYPPGQYWYHSHSRATLLDGLYGSLFIRHKRGAPAPWSLISNDPEDIKAMAKAAANPKSVLISDWDQYTSSQYLKIQEDTNLGIFCVDSILINGKGRVYCPGQAWLTAHQPTFMNESWRYPNTVSDKGCFPYLPITEGPQEWLDKANFSALPPGFTSGCKPSNGSIEIISVDPVDRWASLNFISAATFKLPVVGIDQHPMWIYEVDGQFIEPQRADTFYTWAGERYSAMIKLNQTPQDYPIRVPDGGFSQLVGGYAILRYKTSAAHLKVQKTPWLSYGGEETIPFLDYNGDFLNNATTLDKNKLYPFPSSDPSLKPAPHGDVQYVLDISRVNISWRDSMNYPATYPLDRSAYSPLLYYPNASEALDPNFVIRTKNGTWVDVVFQVGQYEWWPLDFPHPMHKHGNKVWQIGAGAGIYNYSSVDEAIKANASNFNLINPPLRDTFITAFTGAAWIALRYQVVNPGPWLFHCHVETHLATGMAIAIMDAVDTWPEIPPEYGMWQHGLPLNGSERGTTGHYRYYRG